MADLVAQSEGSTHRWRRKLERDSVIVLGRSNANWTVPWDAQISRRHVQLAWDGKQLSVIRIPDSRNPVFHRGLAKEEFAIEPGDYFVIGKTTFTLAQSAVGATLQMPDPAREQLFSKQVLNEVRFRDAEKRLAVLSDLPQLIEGATDDQELFVRLINVVFGGVPQASSAAVVKVEPQQKSETPRSRELPKVQVLHWDRRFAQSDSFQPSQRLIVSACEKQQSILHIWEDPKTLEALTMIDPSHDWAFVTPLPSSGSQRLAIYVSGLLSSNRQAVDSISSIASSLKEDIKFAELAASIAGSLLGLRQLRDRQSSLRTFFSPVVLEALQQENPAAVLEPRQCEVSVLFCDLRGFAATSEKFSSDLMQLLNRVSRALGITTSAILENRGVVGDFHGDATMGFWGWPLAQSDQATRACRAALAIYHEFDRLASSPDDPLHGFEMGLGIASGMAVAGQIGTADQVKVTAFGPVVNLASRLETMNRQLHTSILMDQRTYEKLQIENGVAARETSFENLQVRRIGKVLPVGLTQAIEVHQLQPLDQTDQGRKSAGAFAAAVQAFQEGDWEAAYLKLHDVPSTDRAKDLLTMIITQHNRKAPPDWDGVIRLSSK